MNMFEAIFNRRSVRKYKMEPLETELLEKIRHMIENVSVLDDSCRVEFEIFENLGPKSQAKGLIKCDAPYYLIVYCEDSSSAYRSAATWIISFAEKNKDSDTGRAERHTANAIPRTECPFFVRVNRVTPNSAASSRSVPSGYLYTGQARKKPYPKRIISHPQTRSDRLYALTCFPEFS